MKQKAMEYVRMALYILISISAIMSFRKSIVLFCAMLIACIAFLIIMEIVIESDKKKIHENYLRKLKKEAVNFALERVKHSCQLQKMAQPELGDQMVPLWLLSEENKFLDFIDQESIKYTGKLPKGYLSLKSCWQDPNEVKLKANGTKFQFALNINKDKLTTLPIVVWVGEQKDKPELELLGYDGSVMVNGLVLSYGTYY